MLYKKILKEIVRYIRLRIPLSLYDDNDDMPDVYFKSDSFKISGYTVDLSPVISGNLGYPQVEITFSRPSKICGDEMTLVRYLGFVCVTLDLKQREIIHVAADSNLKIPKIRIYDSVDGGFKIYPLRYDQCCDRVRAVLCMDEIFDENGGRKKNIQDFYNQLTMLNIGLL